MPVHDDPKRGASSAVMNGAAETSQVMAPAPRQTSEDF